jgi:predicted small secreted protein
VNARKALLSVSALVAMTLTSCGTLNRAGKDLMLGVGTPVLMLYGGATDGYTSAKNVRTGLDSNSAIEHGVFGIVHLVDFPLCVFYGLAEAHPYGPEVKPLDFYTGTWFDSWAESGKKGTDAESGEMVPQAR